MRCGFCHNPDLVLNYDTLQTTSEEDVLKFLEERKVWIDGITMSGGEPTIYKDLPEFLKKIKERKFLVKLDTNGTNPEMIKDLIKEKLVDCIAMDIKTSFSEYDKIAGVKVDIQKIKESIELIKNFKDHEFRTTVIPKLITKEHIVEIAKSIKGANKFTIQNIRTSVDMIDNSLKTVLPYKTSELNEMKEAIKDLVKVVNIRN